MAAHRAAPDVPAGLRRAAPRVGRDGALRLAFEVRGRRTVLAESRWTVPLQVLAPLDLGGSACVVSVVNPTGGVVGGDRLDVDVAVGRDAHACLTTPSATKVYRTAGAAAEQRVRMTVAEGGVVEWVPDHTIPFAGAAFRQGLDVDLAAGARAIVVDAFAAGRVARGETWRFTELESALVVRDPAGAVLWDRWALGAGDWGRPGFTDGCPYFATVVVIADAGIEAFCVTANALDGPGATVAAGPLARRGALARCTAVNAAALGDALEALWATARVTTLGLPPLGLRKG